MAKKLTTEQQNNKNLLDKHICQIVCRIITQIFYVCEIGWNWFVRICILRFLGNVKLRLLRSAVDVVKFFLKLLLLASTACFSCNCLLLRINSVTVTHNGEIRIFITTKRIIIFRSQIRIDTITESFIMFECTRNDTKFSGTVLAWGLSTYVWKVKDGRGT